jgi:pyruvate dehydrogenase E1 component
MVVRANMAYGELGGHIASFASAAEIFEVGFNHFFHGSAESLGDLVFFQPHSAPGIYARAFLEGRLTEHELSNYRQEFPGPGLSSYPHPWLMQDFWQFPTGSMGIGPISAIYQARFMRYLEHRGILETSGRHVWGIFGDGEMDEPESVAALTLAARESLDNLTFIINCNLQRLDGPVRGNGQIIQELDALFTGAGWNVIKVLWGSDWDLLFERDEHQVLLQQLSSTVDGQYQTLGANDGQYNLEHFFGLNPDLHRLVSHMTVDEINELTRGGHDIRKLYAAYAAARNHRGSPTVILAKTKKGYGMGNAGESRMTSHQQKKLDLTALRAFRQRFNLDLDDEDLEKMRFYRPHRNSPEIAYLKSRRAALGGPLPTRQRRGASVSVSDINQYAEFALQANERKMSTTVAAVRLINNLTRIDQIGPRIVPIVADEGRTFGMASLFHRLGIYSPSGQLYQPEDQGSILAYRESITGQILEEGITEAGAISSWTAAATAYSVHGTTMLPFYMFYSMFGFQRVGDLIWSAADQRARGFLIGATSGKTTLSGEGLQHQDGSSHLGAATVPNCRAYDPAFACELAVIMHHGMCEMLQDQKDVFYYITVMNELYSQPSLRLGSEADIIKGMYRFTEYKIDQAVGRVQLLGSGAILGEVLRAAELLAEEWNVASVIWSVTSFSELEREARATERWNRLHPDEEPRKSHLHQCLSQSHPIVAATDYVSAYPHMIASYLRCPFTALGTDGFGRSALRSALRDFFEIDARHIVIAALYSMLETKRLSREEVASAVKRYELQADRVPPWEA